MEPTTHVHHRKKLKMICAPYNEGTTSEERPDEVVDDTHVVTHQASCRSNSNSSSLSDSVESDTTTIPSTSTVSNSNDGFQRTEFLLRSVLMHPICLPLVIYLNDVLPNLDLPEYIRTALNSFICRDKKSRREDVFAATVLDWNGEESDFTEKLLFNINHCKIGASAVTIAKGEKQIVGHYGELGKVDYIFKERNTSSVVALFEFGIEHDKWWKKQDRILKYLKMLRRNGNENYTVDQPLLLSVVTINPPPSSNKNKSKKSAKKKSRNDPKVTTLTSNLKRIRTNKNNFGNSPVTAKFGVFICIPKGDNEYRIALLWRCVAENLRDASTQFGKILYAIQLCSYLTNHLNAAAIEYEHLGPNCCRFGQSVRLYKHTTLIVAR